MYIAYKTFVMVRETPEVGKVVVIAFIYPNLL